MYLKSVRNNYPCVFPYYGIQPSLYGYGLWGMERSIRIILFHNVMDRMPDGNQGSKAYRTIIGMTYTSSRGVTHTV